MATLIVSENDYWVFEEARCLKHANPFNTESMIKATGLSKTVVQELTKNYALYKHEYGY